jgi:hypothetical protein
VSYSVTAGHYELVGKALLWTLERGLGDDFTPSVKVAWQEAYAVLSGAMKSAAVIAQPSGRAETAFVSANSTLASDLIAAVLAQAGVPLGGPARFTPIGSGR